jgi:hypothetical protein
VSEGARAWVNESVSEAPGGECASGCVVKSVGKLVSERVKPRVHEWASK